MSKRALFFVFFIFCTILFAQDLPIGVNKNSTEIFFGGMQEAPPIYPSCDTLKFTSDLKDCMSKKISELVAENFNQNIAKSLSLPDGKVRIDASFKIDTLGYVIDIKAIAPHSKLEEEAISILKLIPVMTKPATQRNKPVPIFYNLPIVFMLKN